MSFQGKISFFIFIFSLLICFQKPVSTACVKSSSESPFLPDDYALKVRKRSTRVDSDWSKGLFLIGRLRALLKEYFGSEVENPSLIPFGKIQFKSQNCLTFASPYPLQLNGSNNIHCMIKVYLNEKSFENLKYATSTIQAKSSIFLRENASNHPFILPFEFGELKADHSYGLSVEMLNDFSDLELYIFNYHLSPEHLREYARQMAMLLDELHRVGLSLTPKGMKLNSFVVQRPRPSSKAQSKEEREWFISMVGFHNCKPLDSRSSQEEIIADWKAFGQLMYQMHVLNKHWPSGISIPQCEELLVKDELLELVPKIDTFMPLDIEKWLSEESQELKRVIQDLVDGKITSYSQKLLEYDYFFAKPSSAHELPHLKMRNSQ